MKQYLSTAQWYDLEFEIILSPGGKGLHERQDAYGSAPLEPICKHNTETEIGKMDDR